MSKKVFLLLAIPALLIIGGYLYLRFSIQASIKTAEVKSGTTTPTPKKLGGEKLSEADLRPLFIKRLQQLLKNSSAGLYNLSINDLKIDVLASTITLQGVKMQPDSAILSALKKAGNTPADVYTVSFDSLQIDGVNIDDAINTKTMDYKLVKLVHPLLVIHHQKGAANKKNASDSTFSQRFLVEMQKLAIKKIVVEDGTLAIYNEAKQGGVNEIKHLSVVLDDVLIDSISRNDKDRFLFAKDATLTLRDYHKPTKDRLYNLHVENATIKAPQGDAVLTGVSFTSPLSKAAFMQKHQFSTSLYNLRLPAVHIHHLNWWTLLNEEELVAGEVTAGKGIASVYIDRSLPSRPTYNNFPAQLLMKLSMPVNIQKIDLQNMDFSYEEYSPFSGQSGTLFMDKTHLIINHLCNAKGMQAKPVTVSATALFMHTIPLQATFNFSTANYTRGDFTTTVKTAGFDTRIVNSFSVPMGLVKVEDGIIDSLEVSIKGNRSYATGEVFLPYHHLKLSLLERNKDSPGLNKRHVTSALANLLFVKNNNPKSGSDPRHETAEYKAPAGTPFFSVTWKVILIGALKTIGAPQKIAYETTEPPKKK